MSPRPWDRLLWGIQMQGSDARDRPMLLGEAWTDLEARPGPGFGEPSRALLFTTRALARKFCNAQHAKYAGRDDCCAKWRFKPVRVRETVQVA